MKILLMTLGILALIPILGALFAFPTMWIVNYLFTPTLLMLIFGTIKIGFWKAWVLNIFIGLFTAKTVKVKE